jgi:hypothetical protein
MLEAIIACGIIVTAVSSALTLVISSVSASKDSETAITASNLAREGVEAVRAIRDSNWLAGRPFDAGLRSGTDYAGIPAFDPAAFAGGGAGWSVDYAAADAVTDAAALVWRRDGTGAGVTDGLMTQSAAPPDHAAATPFSRIVFTQPLCGPVGSETVAAQGTDCGAAVQVGLRVSSRVQWRLRDRTRTIEVEERLYDWK